MPSWYEAEHQRLAREGRRVLAVGCKSIKVARQSELKSVSREAGECDLEFAGFAMFDCPIKADSERTVTQLRAASHDVVMITGALLAATRFKRM